MAKFNSTNTIKTTNHDGHVAYSMRDKEKLVTQVLTSFFNEEKFYGDNTKDMVETIKRVVANDPAFISKLAVFARKEFHMRSVAHVLIAYLAHEPAGKPFVRDTIRGVCERGDDLTEIMAFYLTTFGKPIPNSLKKGINDQMVRFDEYTLAKYKGDSKSVKMRDLICLCRPKPETPEQSELFKRCLEDRLETPLTWESELSAHGNNAETWEKLIAGGKVGYMALLRNFRNIINAHPANIDKVYEKIADPVAVKRSKQLPFRYLSAYKSIRDCGTSKAFDALESAVEASIKNIERLPGLSVVAIDVSGSMDSHISAKSEMTAGEIAWMLGIIASRICEDSIVYTFDTSLNTMQISHHTAILNECTRANVGGGTNMSLPFLEIQKRGIKPDRVIVISDNECNSGYSWYHRKTIGQLADETRRSIGRNFWVHAIDLMGYGTQQFSGPETNIIAGWSEKVLDFIRIAEDGKHSIFEKIDRYAW